MENWRVRAYRYDRPRGRTISAACYLMKLSSYTVLYGPSRRFSSVLLAGPKCAYTEGITLTLAHIMPL